MLKSSLFILVPNSQDNMIGAGLSQGYFLFQSTVAINTNGTSVYMFAMVMLHNTAPQSQRRNTTAMHISHEFLGQLDGSTNLGQA